MAQNGLLPTTRWVVMWGLAVVLYALLKTLSWSARQRSDSAIGRHLAFLLAWPGMDVDRFLNAKNVPIPQPSLGEWGFALTKFCFGLGILFVVSPRVSVHGTLVVGWTEMIGIIFTLHFGLFHLLSLFWKSCGLLADPIMNWPIASQSLSEFWGRRWNLAFRDLTHRFLFRPLIPYLGPTGSLAAGFLMSGLIHDLVISLPAQGGFGGPTIFFMIQGVGMMLERHHWGRKIGLGAGLIGRSFCLLVLILPLPLLFHRPFVCTVIVPFLEAMRSLTCSSN